MVNPSEIVQNFAAESAEMGEVNFGDVASVVIASDSFTNALFKPFSKLSAV